MVAFTTSLFTDLLSVAISRLISPTSSLEKKRKLLASQSIPTQNPWCENMNKHKYGLKKKDASWHTTYICIICDCISWRCQTNISNIFWFGTIHSFIVTNRIKVINRWPWFGDMSLVLELAGHHQVARALLNVAADRKGATCLSLDGRWDEMQPHWRAPTSR